MKCLLVVLEIIDLHLIKKKGRQEQLYLTHFFPQGITNTLQSLILIK